MVFINFGRWTVYGSNISTCHTIHVMLCLGCFVPPKGIFPLAHLDIPDQEQQRYQCLSDLEPFCYSQGAHYTTRQTPWRNKCLSIPREHKNI